MSSSFVESLEEEVRTMENLTTNEKKLAGMILLLADELEAVSADLYGEE